MQTNTLFKVVPGATGAQKPWCPGGKQEEGFLPLGGGHGFAGVGPLAQPPGRRRLALGQGSGEHSRERGAWPGPGALRAERGEAQAKQELGREGAESESAGLLGCGRGLGSRRAAEL